MKKILLALLMALPCLGMAQVATQKVVNTATIYSANSPVTFNGNATFSNAFFRTLFDAQLATNMNAGELRSGTILTARYGPEVVLTNGNQTISGIKTFNDNIIGNGTDNTLNNQTLTGNGSIINRVLGDARYAGIANGINTNSSYVFADGTTQSVYRLIVRQYILGNVTITNGVFTVAAQDPTIILSSTNATGQRSVNFTHTGGGNSIIGVSGAAGQFFTGNLAEDFAFRATAGARIVYGIGSTRAFNWNGTTHTFEIGNVVVSNTFSANAYQVAGVAAISAVITNTIGGITNISFFGSGLLTNLIRTP